jgi:hypothetical protein
VVYCTSSIRCRGGERGVGGAEEGSPGGSEPEGRAGPGGGIVAAAVEKAIASLPAQHFLVHFFLKFFLAILGKLSH